MGDLPLRKLFKKTQIPRSQSQGLVYGRDIKTVDSKLARINGLQIAFQQQGEKSFMSPKTKILIPNAQFRLAPSSLRPASLMGDIMRDNFQFC